ncbi:39S ribosomal protein L9, mitochondrial-like [Teleopsis dalmanni]|uniref:39S ribosomal protein L9, mitochondrial-like n=1 Tax=Teleopsis dalmanni TaxID=139649 RepID=UPI0018CDC9A8|nr:39S ribosomal protein L9, mitochondrial-like [Teleopsis dalmanni]
MLKSFCSSQIKLLKTSIAWEQQVRTTFILKRRYEPPLAKKNGPPRRLRAKHFLYDLVEDTGIKKRPDLEVVLKTYVEGVGDKGDVVAARPTFAYNKLLLPGLAVYKTEESVKQYAKTEMEKDKSTHSSPYAQRTVNMLNGLLLGVVMNKDQPWVIEKWHIKASLRKAGFVCPEDCITLPKERIEGPDMNKEGKIFFCTVVINNLENATVKCRIHHWSTDPSERLPYVPEFWKLPSEPLFGSEQEAASNNAEKKE